MSAFDQVLEEDPSVNRIVSPPAIHRTPYPITHSHRSLHIYIQYSSSCTPYSFRVCVRIVGRLGPPLEIDLRERAAREDVARAVPQQERHAEKKVGGGCKVRGVCRELWGAAE